MKKGQAALIAVILMLIIMLSAVFGASAVALTESRAANKSLNSRFSFFAAEAGVDDAVYRLKRGKNLPSSFTINLNGASAPTTVATNGGVKEIKSVGAYFGATRAARATLSNSTGVSFYYGVQVGEGGLEMEQNSEVRGAGGAAGSVYSNGNIEGENGSTITGDAFLAGASTISGVTVGGNIQTGQSSLPMPIPDAVIQAWKNDAAAGGTITGNCGDNGSLGCNIDNNGTLPLGPKKINGNLVLTKKQTLIVTGTLYFTGHLDMDSSSGAAIKCDPSFGTNSCIVIFDGWMHIKNNSVFQGSGTAGSYILVLTTLQNCNGQDGASGCTHHNAGIDLHNNATGAIFYAGDSMINLHNGVGVTELTAYKLQLDNNAVVTYEQGLANANFSSGPSGGWDITGWAEVVP
ncbi:MAG: hypothetical protein HYW15_01020 [Candidatus Giovannonibacteria bacterium]|nr:MAG: hypothetical protein HYW15_01020 [Candidatus Giovannonibacteria bacterium]